MLDLLLRSVFDVEHVNDVLLLDHLTHAADGTEGSTAAAPISKHRVKR